MKSLLCIMLFVLIAEVGDAQNPVVVDSLNELLTHKVGADRYQPLYELAFEYVDRDNEKALEIIEEARKAALLSRDSLWIVKSMRVKAQMLASLERLSESIPCGEEARRIALNNGYEKERARIVNSLAGSYAFCLRYDRSLESYLDVLELEQIAGDSALFASALHNIGVVHARLENHETSLEYFSKAMDLKKELNDVRSFELTNICLSYAYLDQFDNAEYYLSQSIKKCASTCSEMDAMRLHFAAGLIFYRKKDYESATQELTTVYVMAQKMKNVRFQLDVIHMLTELYLDLGLIPKARRLLMDAERLIVRGKDLNLEKLRIFRLLARMHLAATDHKAAAFYQNKYITLKDSLYDNGLTTRLMEIESEFKQRADREVIARQHQILEGKEEIIVRQRYVNILTALLVVITGTFLIFIFRNYLRKRKANIILDQLVAERTNELEMNCNSLLNILSEKDLIIDRVSNGVRAQVTTLHALRSTARSEVVDPLALQYIERCDMASSKIERYLFLLLRPQRLTRNIPVDSVFRLG